MPPPSGKWTNIAYLQGLVGAVNARINAIAPAGSGTTIATPVAGDRADTLIAKLQQGLQLSNAVGSVGGCAWVSPSFDPASITMTANATNAANTAGPFFSCTPPAGSGTTLYVDKTTMDDPYIRHYCGLPDDWALPPIVASWRRKKPRTVTSRIATADTDFNASVAGQRAFYSAPYNVGQPTADQYVVKFNGTVWVPDNTGMPDHLDSSQAPPNYCQGGVARAGDYILSHIWTELEAVINATTTAFAMGPNPAAQILPPSPSGGLFSSYHYNNRSDSGTSSGTNATAAAAEASAISSAIDSATSGPSAGAYTTVSEGSITSFAASAFRSYATVTDMYYPAATIGGGDGRFTVTPRLTKYYVGQDAYSLIGFPTGFGGNPATFAFSNFGDPISATATAEYASGSNGAIENYCATGVPTTFGTPASAGTGAWLGYIPTWFGHLVTFTGLPTV